jgi:hypothetical protein
LTGADAPWKEGREMIVQQETFKAAMWDGVDEKNAFEAAKLISDIPAVRANIVRALLAAYEKGHDDGQFSADAEYSIAPPSIRDEHPDADYYFKIEHPDDGPASSLEDVPV